MWSVRIAFYGDFGTHCREQVARLLNPFPRHMRIRITGAQQNWRATQISRQQDRLVRWTDQATSKSNETCIAFRVPANEFGGETGSLRKSAKCNLRWFEPTRDR